MLRESHNLQSFTEMATHAARPPTVPPWASSSRAWQPVARDHRCCRPAHGACHAPASAVRLASQVCSLPDGDGRGLGGPQPSPANWLWGVYGGASAARRREALGLIEAGTLAAWRERHGQGVASPATLACGRSPALTCWRRMRTVRTSLVIFEIFAFDPMPSRPPNFVYEQLVRAARWLRQGAAHPPRVTSNSAAS